MGQFLVAPPELVVQISKTILVIILASCEIDGVALVTLEDRPAAAIGVHVAVGFLAALTILAESRDDATGGVVTTTTMVQTVFETVWGDVSAGGCWDDTAGGGSLFLPLAEQHWCCPVHDDNNPDS